MKDYDVIVIGGGAAGLFCAIEAGKRGRRTLLIEHNGAVGRKILISGGGRCNFTNLDVTAEHFISANPHFCKSALARYTPQDFIKLVEKHRIEFYEKTLGQLFCRDSSRRIVEMLLDECTEAGVRVLTECSVTAVERAGETGYQLETNRGPVYGQSLVIATGGLSFPKVGATDFGYRIARQFGLKITQTRPSLVALHFAGESKFAKLAGVSLDAAVSADGHEFRENILFTHRGLSGPAILQISNYWIPGEDISINLLPDQNAEELFAERPSGPQPLSTALGRALPHRFADLFAEQELPHKPVDQLSRRDIESIADKLNEWKVKFDGTEGYAKAEVTLGGVSTNELSSQTMEAKRAPGLYFIGEVVDVTGWLGGYNFQWAWSSGFAAGQAV
ncbi:MAG: NAD(P)/FAD-dependent oxidoreductase [Pyrinomonadaceae bacterium]